MTTSFLMKQMPNRKGNISGKPAQNSGGSMDTVGATNVTANTVRVAQPKGQQGAPKASGNIFASSGKPQVSRPKADYCNNDGYRSSSFLK